MIEVITIANNCYCMKCFATMMLSFVFAITAFGQVKQKFKITDLEFMTGTWKTTSDWGDMEEIWSAPMGDCMMCTFRCIKDAKVVFYEFIVIEQTENDSVPVLKLRHFNPGSIGREDKDKPYAYPMTFSKGQSAIFERPDKKTIITYERVSKDTLKSVLIQETGEKKKTTEFIYSRSQN